MTLLYSICQLFFPLLGNPEHVISKPQLDVDIVRDRSPWTYCFYKDPFSADLVELISWVCELCGLPPAPVEVKKMCGFCAALDMDDQSSSSLCLLIGDASSDILVGIDECISFPPTGMWLRKVSKVLPYFGVQSRQYSLIEGEEVIWYWFLSGAFMEVGGKKSFENLKKADVVFSSSENEDLEATVRTLLEPTFWMDSGIMLLSLSPCRIPLRGPI